jgi:uncharacterized protein
MLAPIVDAKITRLHELLRVRFGTRLREVTLFGSHARGDAHEESDVDVLVVIDDLSHSEIAEVSGLAYDVDAASPNEWVGLAPLAMSTATAAEMRARERLLFQEIDREGIPL